MKFFIEKMVLWPVDKSKNLRTLNFKPQKINIIHGKSRTGKSSILSIIDYCLGSSRCSIPVGIIREKVEWFGLIIIVKNTRILIARKTPDLKNVSKEFYVKGLSDDELPVYFEANYDTNLVKSLFNDRILKLSNVPQTEKKELGRYDGRASYRDLAAFNFLPQHIVANPNTLFYKADSNDHKERLRKIFPLALGIVDNQYLTKERERGILQKEVDILERKKEAKLRAQSVWETDVEILWNQAVELGLVENKESETLEKRIYILQQFIRNSNKYGYDKLISSPNYDYSNDKYQEYKRYEKELQISVDSTRKKIRNYESMSANALGFSEAIAIEKSRFVGFTWLKDNIKNENFCIACGSNTNQLASLFSYLEVKVNGLKSLSNVLNESPIVDKEIEKYKIELRELQGYLQEARLKRLSLEKIDNASKDSLSKVFILIGRIQGLLINYAENKNEDELSQKIIELNKQIQLLDNYFLNKNFIQESEKVYNEISELISFYAKEFNLEEIGKVNLESSELTLSFTGKRKKEYLWEVGSGANWMGYHIATFLALHEYFSNDIEDNLPVFSFLVIDQPSQVYFPTAVSGANLLDDVDKNIDLMNTEREDDILATKRIFEMLRLGLVKSNFGFQIIVLEHADQSIWGSVENTHEVANWKGENEGLIPSHWLDK
ncbi:hypothetical protein AYK86_04740 [Acinetobacter venetianus]|uniref:DUF3732 domain-containing protein n=1 Tax=Acinetobacter venetianus TaxID=52133 RepID=UPI000775ECE3|nr:DUF3732 domain-containing protein [Acinetobacter venetianus]KXO85511.1 hypothetical protein AYK86_04740 [Acinetobacter venetianus]